MESNRPLVTETREVGKAYNNVEAKMKLSISHLGKQYRRDFWGLRDMTLELGPGVMGLLGPNGAGKSTLMRILATITRPTEGTVHWNDTDILQSPDTLRAVLGYLPQDFGIYPNLTGYEFLEYMAAIKGMDANTARRRIEELLVVVNLVDAARRPLAGYSGGMKQRVGIAQALLNDPQLLIVDEPTVGLDPAERVRFRNLLSDLAGERIVILSTHIVSDVEATASDIVIINKGRQVQRATPEKLLALLEGQVWQWVVPEEQLTRLKQTYLVSGTVRRADGIQTRIVSPTAPAGEAHAVTPNLEDVYLYLTSQDGGGR
jgi:ABC-2 type transport system ATP-binding protein